MSKSVRLKDYLAAELEAMAARENRSLQNLVEHLLRQAIEMDNRPVTKEIQGMEILNPDGTVGRVTGQVTTTPAAERNRTDADAESRDVRARTVETGEIKSDFKPDPKPKGKRR